MDQDQAIIPTDVSSSVQKYDEQTFNDMSAGGSLPRVQLMIASASACKSGEFPINHYALIKNQNKTDLGKEIDIIVIAWKPKAMDTSGDEVIVSHKPKTPLFDSIVAKSAIKDSGCMQGPEFLIYVPTVKKYATFFLGTKSARREASNVLGRLGKAATLKSRNVQWKGFDWYAPVCIACTGAFELPATEEIIAQANKFNTDTDSELEEAVATGGDEQAR